MINEKYTNDYDIERNSRTAMLLGDAVYKILPSCHVVVFGLGGVGSYVTEALCRSNIGKLTLVDNDIVSISNLNRQLYALKSNLGKKKTEVAATRCLDINEHIFIDKRDSFILPENTEDFFNSIERPDYVVDAIDTISSKISIAEYCFKNNIPLISCCGTGNKLEAGKFEITDIYKTSVCPLCRVMRKELKERKIKKLKVCYSKEQPIKTGSRVPGSVSFVPGSAGLLIASEVIKDLSAQISL
ncbi:MAG: tRNA threonylcarbamoyladenosine dehydratase [Eubacteriales bacterium]|nr:tRNA threonylcarbamoyladenosine dehydratase [Eubacteriales bacterium]